MSTGKEWWLCLIRGLSKPSLGTAREPQKKKKSKPEGKTAKTQEKNTQVKMEELTAKVMALNNYKSSQGSPRPSSDWLSHLRLERVTFPSLSNNTLGFPLKFYELDSLQLTPMCESQGVCTPAPFSGTPVCLLGKSVGQFGLVWTRHRTLDVDQTLHSTSGNHLQEVIYNAELCQAISFENDHRLKEP